MVSTMSRTRQILSDSALAKEQAPATLGFRMTKVGSLAEGVRGMIVEDTALWKWGWYHNIWTCISALSQHGLCFQNLIKNEEQDGNF